MSWVLVPLALAAAFAAGVLRGCLAGRRDIWTVCGDAVYLQRWYLAGGRHEDTDHPAPVALFLHRMLLPDPDREPHDHPWSFLTLVLWGGYVEEVQLPPPTWDDHPVTCPAFVAGYQGVPGGACTCPSRTLRRLVRPGTLNWRPAEHTHRIDSLPRGWALTLVLRLRRRRKWGFHTLSGWVPWRRHLDDRRSALCGED